MLFQEGENIKVVGQSPRHGIGRCVGREVRRVKKEYSARIVLVLGKDFPIIARDDGQPIEIARGLIVGAPHIVVKLSPFKLSQ